MWARFRTTPENALRKRDLRGWRARGSSGTGREPVTVRAQWTEQHGVVVWWLAEGGKEQKQETL